MHDYSTREGVSRPGWRRLMANTEHGRRWVAKHLQHLEDDGHVVVRRKGGFLPGKGVERSTEYLVPWLSGVHTTTRRLQPGSETPNGTSGGRSGGQSDGQMRAPLSVLRTERYANDAAAAPAPGGSVVVRRTGAAGGPNVDESAPVCATCGGDGFVPLTNDDGVRRLDRCPTCGGKAVKGK
jgi:hypothetical protein